MIPPLLPRLLRSLGGDGEIGITVGRLAVGMEIGDAEKGGIGPEDDVGVLFIRILRPAANDDTRSPLYLSENTALIVEGTRHIRVGRPTGGNFLQFLMLVVRRGDSEKRRASLREFVTAGQCGENREGARMVLANGHGSPGGILSNHSVMFRDRLEEGLCAGIARRPNIGKIVSIGADVSARGQFPFPRDRDPGSLFVIGMEFPIDKLKTIGKKTTIIAVTEAFGTFALGYVAAQAMGFALYDSMFVALAVSVTSTVIVMRVLEEMNMINEDAANLIVGVAVIEDIIIISMLAVLQSIASTGDLSAVEIGTSVGFVAAFIIGAIVVGTRTVPRYVNIIGKTGHNEFVIIAMLGLAFGLSVIAFKIGISVATGAFFAGVLVAGTKMRLTTKNLALPIRDMFAALFFISVGGLMDVRQVQVFIFPAIALVAVSFFAKFFTVWISAKAQGFGRQTALRSGF